MLELDGGLVEVGHDRRAGRFAFDNESPRHKVYLEPFRIADRLVTAGEWLAFMDDDGYRRPELWLSDGWYAVQEHEWRRAVLLARRRRRLVGVHAGRLAPRSTPTSRSCT